jgi:pyridinium-3,5-bisthiocarboxylic acid mononucleotide nickel chelatase
MDTVFIRGFRPRIAVREAIVRTLYFDTFSGISGDMTVGALLALGVPLEHLRGELGRLDLRGYHLVAERRMVNGITATKFDVHLEDEHGHGHPRHAHAHRAFRDIRALIESSGLDPEVKDVALRVFTRLAEAEGRVHEKPPEEVTFHEVGAVDSIVDIVGTAIGYCHLGVERAFVGALPAGSGVVSSQHGRLPVPPPATVELLRGFDLRLGDGVGELVTPTGAAIVAALATPLMHPAALRLDAVGYGAGTRRLEDRPNLLRLVLGEGSAGLESDEMVLIETNIDDGNPEFFDFVMERLFAAGARDVFLSPIQMKKNRPGTLLRVLGEPANRDRLAAIVLSETSAIGVRFLPVSRLKLPRRVVTVKTEFGEVRVKISRAPDGRDQAAPEYDDCARLARAASVPIKVVYQAALDAARSADSSQL